MGKSDEVPTKVDASQADSGLFEVSYNSERCARANAHTERGTCVRTRAGSRYYSVVTISVKVRGQDVPGSPFSARMKEHPMHELYNLRAVVGVEIQVDAEPGKGVRLLNVRANSPAQRAGMVIDADFIYAVQANALPALGALSLPIPMLVCLRPHALAHARAHATTRLHAFLPTHPRTYVYTYARAHLGARCG